MDLLDFKTVLEEKGDSGVKQVFVGYREKPNVADSKLYPFVLWDVNTLDGVMDSRTSREEISMRAYIVKYYDYHGQTEDKDVMEIYDELRAIFLLYLAEINSSDYVQVMNLDNLRYQLYNRGLFVDSEVGIHYDVQMKLFC
jgi:hypothetical protein